MTVILLTCSYKEKEFVRVGYYVSNDYEDEELRTNPPAAPVLEKLSRHILSDQPRVTRIPIPWDGEEEMPPPVKEEEITGEIIEASGLGGGAGADEEDDDEEMEDDEMEEEGEGEGEGDEEVDDDEQDDDEMDEDEDDEEEDDDEGKEIDLVEEEMQDDLNKENPPPKPSVISESAKVAESTIIHPHLPPTLNTV